MLEKTRGLEKRIKALRTAKRPRVEQEQQTEEIPSQKNIAHTFSSQIVSNDRHETTDFNTEDNKFTIKVEDNPSYSGYRKHH